MAKVQIQAEDPIQNHFYVPHVRLERTVSDPPTLIYCCAIYVEANTKLTCEYDDVLAKTNIVRYTKSGGLIDSKHWEHFRFSWNWNDYPDPKEVISIVNDLIESRNSSDRAEPCSS